jgi:peroxiredoxin Q/BCP
MAGIEVGQAAPDFTLPGVQGTERRDYTLSEYRGSKVMLAFYPGDFTMGCTRQLCGYRDDYQLLAPAGVTVLAISPQDIDSHERFIAAKNFEFPLLSDTDMKVIAAYGVQAPVIGVRRAVFLLDAAGIVRWQTVKLIGATWPKAKELAEIMARF